MAGIITFGHRNERFRSRCLKSLGSINRRAEGRQNREDPGNKVERGSSPVLDGVKFCAFCQGHIPYYTCRDI